MCKPEKKQNTSILRLLTVLLTLVRLLSSKTSVVIRITVGDCFSTTQNYFLRYLKIFMKILVTLHM